MRIKVAGHCIKLHAAQEFLAGLRCEYALFLTEETPDITVTIDVSKNASTSDGAWGECALVGNFMHFLDDCSIGWCDFSLKQAGLTVLPGNPKGSLGTFLRNIVTVLLVRSNAGLLLHGAGIVHRGEAFIFVGPSGAGKSTVASLSPDKPLLSDENLFIKKERGLFVCCPAPSWGDSQQRIRSAESVPVGKLFKLIQDTSVSIEPIAGAQALAEMFTVAGIMLPGHSVKNMLAVFAEFLESVPAYALRFRREPSFWEQIDSLSCAHAHA